MAEVKNKLKAAWMKGMEAVGTTAGNIASSTKTRVEELNLATRRREILQEFSEKAYTLWQEHRLSLPQELDKMLDELEQTDKRLTLLRAERLAGLKTEEAGETVEKAPAMEIPAKEKVSSPVPDPADPVPAAPKADDALSPAGEPADETPESASPSLLAPEKKAAPAAGKYEALQIPEPPKAPRAEIDTRLPSRREAPTLEIPAREAKPAAAPYEALNTENPLEALQQAAQQAAAASDNLQEANKALLQEMSDHITREGLSLNEQLKNS